MKKWLYLNLVLVATVILGACSTSNSVVSNKLISKRKYNKGFHINKKAHLKDSKETLASEDLKEESKETRKSTFRKSNDNSTTVASVSKEEITSEVSEESYEEVSYIESTRFEDNVPSEFSDSEEDIYIAETIQEEKPSQNTVSELVESVSSGARPDDTVMLILLIILCLILPPVAIAIYRGIDTIFWIDLILFIAAIGGWWLVGPLSGIAGLASVIIAFLVIFDVI